MILFISIIFFLLLLFGLVCRFSISSFHLSKSLFIYNFYFNLVLVQMVGTVPHSEPKRIVIKSLYQQRINLFTPRYTIVRFLMWWTVFVFLDCHKLRYNMSIDNKCSAVYFNFFFFCFVSYFFLALSFLCEILGGFVRAFSITMSAVSKDRDFGSN